MTQPMLVPPVPRDSAFEVFVVVVVVGGGGGGGSSGVSGSFLACEDFGRACDQLFPACAFFVGFFFFLKW